MENNRPTPPIELLIQHNVSEFDKLESNVIAACSGQIPQSMLISSSNPSEGKTTTAALIGMSMASRGDNNVLLVDGHIRQPALHRLFGMDNPAGLAEVILQNIPWQHVIRSYGDSRLHLMSAGNTKENPLKIIRSPEFKSTIEEWHELYDCIIFDGPQILGSSECAYLASMVEGVLLVISCEKTRWELAQTAKSKIESVKGTVIGCILNRRKYYIPGFLYGIM